MRPDLVSAVVLGWHEDSDGFLEETDVGEWWRCKSVIKMFMDQAMGLFMILRISYLRLPFVKSLEG